MILLLGTKRIKIGMFLLKKMVIKEKINLIIQEAQQIKKLRYIFLMLMFQ